VPSLVADKGGPDAVSYAEQRVMETAAVSRVWCALALAAGDLDSVVCFLAAERDALRALGLGRRARQTPGAHELLARHADNPTDGRE
jgi:hypothetical protein